MRDSDVLEKIGLVRFVTDLRENGSASDFVTDLKSDLRQVQFSRGLRRSSQDLA